MMHTWQETHDFLGVAAESLEHDGCRLRYWLLGPKGRPPVVLTHGASIDHREFAEAAQALSGRYRLLLWDVRGHGLSRPAEPRFSVPLAVDDLLAILDALGWPRAAFVGHSLGGNITQEVAFRHPQRTAVLAILGSTCNTLPLSLPDRLGLALGIPLLRVYPWERLRRDSARGSSVVPAVQDWLYERLGEAGHQDFVDTLAEGARCLHAEPDYCIEQPLLLAHGDQDITGNIRRIAPRWAAREPDCTYVVVPNAGHMANRDNPEFFNRILLEFLEARYPSE